MLMYLLLAMVPIIMTPVVNTLYKSSIDKNDRAKRTFLLCCGAFLFVMIAFRSQYVGTEDSQRYYYNWALLSDMPYSRLGDYLVSTEMESGYLASVWLLSHLIPYPQMLFVFSGLLFTSSVCRFIYKNSDDVCMSFVMFVSLGLYTFMVQGLRQAVAMSICLFAFEFAKKKKLIPFLLLVFFAMLFHKTAIVFLVVYFINILKMNWKSYALVGVGSAIVLAGSGYIVEICKILFNEEAYDTKVESGGLVATAIYVLILAVGFIFSNKKQKNDELFKFFFYFTYIGLFTYVLRYVELVILERISYYFLFGQIVLLPKVLNNFDGKVKSITKTITLILCILLFMYRLSSSDLIPYLFFWQ